MPQRGAQSDDEESGVPIQTVKSLTCPLSAFILIRGALEIGSQVLYSLFIASGGNAEGGKLIEGVNVALRGRSSIEVFGFRVFQFLDRKSTRLNSSH